MSKKTFTKEEIDKLKKNKYLKKVSEKGITYTDEFKRYLLMKATKGLYQERYLKNMDLKLIF